MYGETKKARVASTITGREGLVGAQTVLQAGHWVAAGNPPYSAFDDASVHEQMVMMGLG